MSVVECRVLTNVHGRDAVLQPMSTVEMTGIWHRFKSTNVPKLNPNRLHTVEGKSGSPVLLGVPALLDPLLGVLPPPCRPIAPAPTATRASSITRSEG
jgi:hypothetical protein